MPGAKWGDAGSRVVVSRAREAPSRPGVYIMLGADRELLYVGKTTNLHRRLLDYGRATTDVPGAPGKGLVAETRELLWLDCADEREALCLEADLVVALAPPFNASMAEEAYTFVSVGHRSAHGRARLHFSVTQDTLVDCERRYGTFPHLGKGKSSWRAVRSNAGYSALLRLLWVAFAEPERRFRLPARLRGSSPPVAHDTPFDVERWAMLHDFLSGRSSRLLIALRQLVTSDAVPAFMRRPLEEDQAKASEFYALGPRALRSLRRSHGVPPGPVDPQTFTELVSDDLRGAIGSFKAPSRSIGSRGRARSMESRALARERHA